MQARIFPLTMLELIDMLTSGRTKLANELVTELRNYESQNQRKV
jgi:hypothetical protein